MSNVAIAERLGVAEGAARSILATPQNPHCTKTASSDLEPLDRLRQVEDSAKAGAEAYFPVARASAEMPTMGGLKAAHGPPPRAPKPAPLPEDFKAWSDWTVAAETLAHPDADIAALTARPASRSAGRVPRRAAGSGPRRRAALRRLGSYGVRPGRAGPVHTAGFPPRTDMTAPPIDVQQRDACGPAPASTC